MNIAGPVLAYRRQRARATTLTGLIIIRFIARLAFQIKAFSSRGREISWLTYTLALVLALYFVELFFLDLRPSDRKVF